MSLCFGPSSSVTASFGAVPCRCLKQHTTCQGHVRAVKKHNTTQQPITGQINSNHHHYRALPVHGGNVRDVRRGRSASVFRRLCATKSRRKERTCRDNHMEEVGEEDSGNRWKACGEPDSQHQRAKLTASAAWCSAVRPSLSLAVGSAPVPHSHTQSFQRALALA